MTNFTDKIKAVYQYTNNLSGGSLDVLRHTFKSFNDTRAAQAAAGMAYYAIFSLFPLLLALIAVGSFVLESDQVYENVVQFVAEAFPGSETLIEGNIQRVLSLRGPVGIAGVASLLWSGTGVFSVLAFNVNLAWPEAEPRNLLEKRLVAIGMVGGLVGLLILSLVSTAAINLLPQLEVPLWGGISIYETPLWTLLSTFISWLFTFLLFLNLYRWVPNTEVKWSGALGGALVATVAWELATSAFAWYLSSGFSQYELVYGSLGAVVALMLWIYLSSLITLFGAHLGAAIAQRAQRRPPSV